MNENMDKTAVSLHAFNQHAEAYEARFDHLQLYRHALCRFAAHTGDHHRVLDVGCGPGNVARYLLSQNASLQIVGVDQAPEMIRLAQRKVPEATFEVCDMRSISFPPAHFDHVVASFCLPFLYDDEAADFLDNLSQMLKPGGFMYLSTMEGDGHRYERTSFGGDTIFFFNYYRHEFLETAFLRNQLRIEDEWLQDYPAREGVAPFKEMLFIIRKPQTAPR